MKVLAITQARINSIRLPGKIFKDIEGQKIIDIHIERVQKATQIDKLILATTYNPSDDILVSYLQEKNLIEIYRGSENNVLERFYLAAKPYQPNYVVRLTSDCPLIDPHL
ncbi:MAG: hypothetical protein HQ463_09365, partial [Bacteroidetes bacterium]|nr:hypothetical protein [Bacteroidota bacterium]